MPLLYYIRHGETDWNVEARLQGGRDIPLNANGRAQATHSGEVLRELLAHDALDPASLDYIASPLGRTRETMERVRTALALDPELLFLDEPTAGLDPIGAAAFDALTRELQETLGLTVFLITHDLDTLYEICDRVAVLADHKVIAVGTIPELLALDHPWIQEYFNGPRGRAAKASIDRAKAIDKPGKAGA